MGNPERSNINLSYLLPSLYLRIQYFPPWVVTVFPLIQRVQEARLYSGYKGEGSLLALGSSLFEGTYILKNK